MSPPFLVVQYVTEGKETLLLLNKIPFPNTFRYIFAHSGLMKREGYYLHNGENNLIFAFRAWKALPKKGKVRSLKI